MFKPSAWLIFAHDLLSSYFAKSATKLSWTYTRTESPLWCFAIVIYQKNPDKCRLNPILHTGLSSSATTLQEDWIKCKYKTKMRLYKCFLIKIFLRKGAAQLSPAEDWSSNQQKQASLVTCHASTHGQQASNFTSCFWGGVSTYLQAGEERNRFILPHLQQLSWILDRATLAGPRL